ncbi:hypothetical protein [Stomatohabitans albus]|uniref:hypothetical protein n=1 Tax=Stomatohabitans albus TaxID=3110766 RepID=UPI00300D4282
MVLTPHYVKTNDRKFTMTIPPSPPTESDPPGSQGNDPQWQHQLSATQPNDQVQPGETITPVLAEGGRSWRALGVALLTMAAPVLALSLWGLEVGPITIEHAQNDSITVEGPSHDLVLTLPVDCSETLEDPTMTSLSCGEADDEVSLTIMPSDSIEQLDVAARRGVRRAIFDRDSDRFEVSDTTIEGGKAALATGQGTIIPYGAAFAVQGDGAKDGFVVGVSPSDSALIQEVSHHQQIIDSVVHSLIQSARLTAKEVDHA